MAMEYLHMLWTVNTLFCELTSILVTFSAQSKLPKCTLLRKGGNWMITVTFSTAYLSCCEAKTGKRRRILMLQGSQTTFLGLPSLIPALVSAYRHREAENCDRASIHLLLDSRTCPLQTGPFSTSNLVLSPFCTLSPSWAFCLGLKQRAITSHQG